MKRICQADERAKLAMWELNMGKTELDIEGQRNKAPSGKKRRWARFCSTDTGCRLGKDGQAKKTFQSPFVEEMNRVKLWSQRQMEDGLDLNITDLSDEFILILESTEYELKLLQKDQGCLSVEDTVKLKITSDRLTKMRECKWNMRYLRSRLACVCNLVQRMPGNVVPFTAQENEMIIKLSWQAWDWLVDILARAPVEKLRGFVSEPELFSKNRASIAVIAQDAVPVYLDMSTGRLMRKPDDGPIQDDIILTWCPSS